MLSKIDECETDSEVAKSVNVLIAIRWIAQAWDSVGEETIRKCFRKAGSVCDDGCVTSRYEEDPFANLDGEENNGEMTIKKCKHRKRSNEKWRELFGL